MEFDIWNSEFDDWNLEIDKAFRYTQHPTHYTRLAKQGSDSLHPALRSKAELAAGGEDVATAGDAQVIGDAAVFQLGLKRADGDVRSGTEAQLWTGIPTDQVHFAGQLADQFRQLTRVSD